MPWLKEEDEETETGRAEVANRMLGADLLGMELGKARESTLSVVEVAAHKEKPGVQTPSREKSGARLVINEVVTRGTSVDGPSDQNMVNGVVLEAAGNGVTLGTDGKVLGDEKSPFEVEGEA